MVGWLDPKGKVIKIPYSESHGESANRLLKTKRMLPDIQAVDKLTSKGWTRIGNRHELGEVYVLADKPHPHTLDYIKDVIKSGDKVYADIGGESAEITNRLELGHFLNKFLGKIGKGTLGVLGSAAGGAALNVLMDQSPVGAGTPLEWAESQGPSSPSINPMTMIKAEQTQEALR